MISTSKGGLVIAYDSKALLFREGYEVLCGSPTMATWVPAHGKFDPKMPAKQYPGARPLVCGNEKHGEPLYAATTSHNGRDYGGKVSVKSKGILYPQNGEEQRNKEYFVLYETKPQ